MYGLNVDVDDTQSLRHMLRVRQCAGDLTWELVCSEYLLFVSVTLKRSELQHGVVALAAALWELTFFSRFFANGELGTGNAQQHTQDSTKSDTPED